MVDYQSQVIKSIFLISCILYLFFRKYVDKLQIEDKYKSTIKLRLGDRLACFQVLHDKNVEWSTVATDVNKITDPSQAPFKRVISSPQ